LELQGHGGATNLRRLLGAVVAAGARPAERGEFTLRAFLNGRIDLSQAEAVLDVVQARTETALDIAHKQLQGGLSQQIRRILSSLIDVQALLEAQIDFVEEDLDEAHSLRPTLAIQETNDAIARSISSFRRGQIIKDGVRVVILGAPNAGKSSLFNALLQQSRAIVTDIPGTTRDFIEETIDLRGIPVTLVDTAGICTTNNPVELAGVERALALADSADLILLLTDATLSLASDEISLGVDPHKIIPIKTKSDLAPGDLSVVTGDGIDELIERIYTAILPEGGIAQQGLVITSARHHEALCAAGEATGQALTACREGEAPDIISVEIQEAIAQLGLIVGATTTEDLLDRIFSTFCIGK
jgi:tRNA modification GTPase